MPHRTTPAAVHRANGFPGALDALYRAGARVLRIPAGEGRDPDRLEHVVRTHRPALVYLVPTHHNPTGLVMPAGHRRRVARLAAAHPDTLFVDDMTLAELPLGDHPVPPPLAALDPAQPNLVSVGSLAKLYWGGLRTGWIRASTGLIARIAAAKAAADLSSAAFSQAIAAALLNDEHDDIVKWRREWLRARHDALTGALRSALPEWTWPEPDGGLTLWVRLPRPADSGAFAQAALRHGVAVVPGRLLSAHAGREAAARPAAGGRAPAGRANTCGWRSPSRRTSWPGRPLPSPGPARGTYTRAVPISPFLVTSAVSSSAASASVPAGRTGSTM